MNRDPRCCLQGRVAKTEDSKLRKRYRPQVARLHDVAQPNGDNGGDNSQVLHSV